MTDLRTNAVTDPKNARAFRIIALHGAVGGVPGYTCA